MAKSNSDNTIKFLIYLLLFLIFALVVLLLLIIPGMKSYKSKRADLYSAVSQNKHLSKRQVALKQGIDHFKDENSVLLKTFENDFNETHFISFAETFFTNVHLTGGKEEKRQGGFTAYAFSATSQTKTPTGFYKFIDALAQYETVVKINFPITLTSQGESINLDFNLSVYKNDK